jgi:hypothetical protein
MKRTLSAIILACLLTSMAAGREWNSRDGNFKVEAELLDVKEGNVVLKCTDGREITVPVKKLSLGDIRYVNQVLKEAEASLGDGSPVTSSSLGKSSPASETSSKATISSAERYRLNYDWKAGKTYVYRIKISADRGDYAEEYSGDVTYKAATSKDEGFVLTVTGGLNRGEKSLPDARVIHMGRHHVYLDSPPPSKSITLAMNSRGQVSRMDGSSPLPYLLGDLSQLVVEPLGSPTEESWTVANYTGITVISNFFPYHRFSSAHFHEGVEANEKATYRIVGGHDKQISVAKHYVLTSVSEFAGKPRFEATGDGTVKFDIEKGLFGSMDFTMRVVVRQKNKTEEIPVKVTYRLLGDEEVAQVAKAEEDARRERKRPLSPQEIDAAVADMISADRLKAMKAAELLSKKPPANPGPKVLKSLETVLAQASDPLVRAAAANVIKNFATERQIPLFLNALSDNWPPVRNAAIEALIKLKSPKAIGPVAQCLNDPHSRQDAARFLKAMGPAAEDAVIAQLKAPDEWTRKDACEVLQAIGTKKSIPALENAAAAGGMMVQHAASAALAAVRGRASMR